jgi:hypothetical protein
VCVRARTEAWKAAWARGRVGAAFLKKYTAARPQLACQFCSRESGAHRQLDLKGRTDRGEQARRPPSSCLQRQITLRWPLPFCLSSSIPPSTTSTAASSSSLHISYSSSASSPPPPLPPLSFHSSIQQSQTIRQANCEGARSAKMCGRRPSRERRSLE